MLLSVLDQSPIPAGGNGGQSLRNSIELAQLADELGYHRFWMAEHHATPALASASPEIMLSALGMATKRIRLGTGGVMLPHYSAFKVAESFSMLAGLFPGRIDLGIGRAPGSDQLTAVALQQDRSRRAPYIFPEQVGELLGYYDGALPGDHLFRHLPRTLPGGAEKPEIWMLGSSPDSARLAAAMGLPYCIADFIAGESPDLAELYRHSFQPSARAAAPQLMVACWTIAGDSLEHAEYLAASSRMMMALLRQGRFVAVPSPEDALEWLAENPTPVPSGRAPILGDAAQCASAIHRKAELYGAGEVMLVNILHGHGQRLESYRRIAGEMLR